MKSSMILFVLAVGSTFVGDASAALQHCQRLVESLGLELLVLDQTRPDLDIPVVKVVVPGLRHFRPRFAPGRLYDVPLRMGWLDEPNDESALNS